MEKPDTISALLQREYESRCARNSRYSLRAFARDVGLSPGGLSQVLRGRMGLSEKTASRIAERLGWSRPEQIHFRDLTISQYSKNRQQRELARVRLLKRQKVETLTL